MMASLQSQGQYLCAEDQQQQRGHTSHWLSLDHRGSVKYGRGYAMQETILLAAQLLPSREPAFDVCARERVAAGCQAAPSALGKH